MFDEMVQSGFSFTQHAQREPEVAPVIKQSANQGEGGDSEVAAESDTPPAEQPDQGDELGQVSFQSLMRI